MDKQYEERLNYPSLLLMQINDIRLAIQSGKPGTIELEGLYMLLASDIKKDMEQPIQIIIDEFTKDSEAKMALWVNSVGHSANNTETVYLTQARKDCLIAMQALRNQRIVSVIIDVLYRKGLLVTPAHIAMSANLI